MKVDLFSFSRWLVIAQASVKLWSDIMPTTMVRFENVMPLPPRGGVSSFDDQNLKIKLSTSQAIVDKSDIV